MENTMFMKRFFLLCGTIVFAGASALMALESVQPLSDEAIIEDATDRIKRVLDTNDGVYKVSCIYKDNEVIVKTHYSDYHKRADRCVEQLPTQLSGSLVREVIFDRPNKRSLFFVAKDTKRKKRLFQKHVNLQSELRA